MQFAGKYKEAVLQEADLYFQGSKRTLLMVMMIESRKGWTEQQPGQPCSLPPLQASLPPRLFRNNWKREQAIFLVQLLLSTPMCPLTPGGWVYLHM